MQPLLNLRSFVALLLVLAVPGALFTAYFRNYSPEAGGHGHGESAGKEMKGHNGMASAPGKGESPAHGGGDMTPKENAPPMSEEAPSTAPLHIGAKGFFLDRPQSFTPRADQAKFFAELKERSAMAMMAADKKLAAAEKRLWTLTGSDRPDLAAIETAVREVEKLRADQRIAFIRTVAEAADVLTPEQKAALARTVAERAPPATPSAIAPAKSSDKSPAAHPH